MSSGPDKTKASDIIKVSTIIGIFYTTFLLKANGFSRCLHVVHYTYIIYIYEAIRVRYAEDIIRRHSANWSTIMLRNNHFLYKAIS